MGKSLLKGFIKKLDGNMVTFVCAENWNVEPNSEPIALGNSVVIKLPIKKEILDKAIKLCTKYLEFKVENGQIIDVKELKVSSIEPEEFFVTKVKTLRDKILVTLSEIVELEREAGVADEQILLQRLETKYEIPKDEGKALLQQLTREGTIYYCADDKIKKT